MKWQVSFRLVACVPGHLCNHTAPVLDPSTFLLQICRCEPPQAEKHAFRNTVSYILYVFENKELNVCILSPSFLLFSPP